MFIFVHEKNYSKKIKSVFVGIHYRHCIMQEIQHALLFRLNFIKNYFNKFSFELP